MKNGIFHHYKAEVFIMRKNFLPALLTVVLLFCCVTVQAEAKEEGCKHGLTGLRITSRTITGGYDHTYTGSDGTTKVCTVNTGTYTYVEVCIDCGAQVGSGDGTFSDHSTNHK